jgi:hypothetical protein
MLKEIARELRKPRIYIAILIGVAILFYSGYGWFGHLGLNDPDIAGNIKAQNVLKTEYWNIYNIVMKSYVQYILYAYPFFMFVPYVYKFNNENRTNFSDLIVIRMGIKKYLAERILVGGFLGGLCLSAIDAVYYLTLKIFLIDAVIKFDAKPWGYFAWLWSAHPREYLMIMWAEHFVLGFAFGALAMGICMFIRHRPLIYIAPFAFFMLYEFLLGFAGGRLAGYSFDINYIMTNDGGKDPAQIAVLFVCFVAAGLALALIWGKRRRLYGK